MPSVRHVSQEIDWQMRSIPQLRSLAPDPIAWVHPSTAKEAGIVDGDNVLVETRRGKAKVKASVTEDMMPGIVSLAHGWEKEANANVLTELDAKDPVTGYCEFRNIACRIGKAGRW
jgi:anaerobic selenocysteine-containing dehydrogenase